MASPLSMQKFLKSEEADLIRAELMKMVADKTFNTTSSYSPTQEDRVSFVDKHMNYLGQHPSVNSHHYLSNLRLMTRTTVVK